MNGELNCSDLIGVAVKAGFSCDACEGFVPVNAYVRTIRCPACGREVTMGLSQWKTILDDALKETPHLEEGEGRSSTIFGSLSLKREYGRLTPRYEGTSDPIPMDLAVSSCAKGFVQDPGTGMRTPVRRFPDHFDGSFAGVVALVGEEESLLPGNAGGDELGTGDETAPVALQCPRCGGSLIVSGRERTETCGYCGTPVTLPDELWQMLHQVRKMKRWFLLLDTSRVPFTWDEDVYCASGDGTGNLITVTHDPYGDNLLVTRVTPGRRVLWSREDLEVSCRSDGSAPGLGLWAGKEIIIAHENGRDLRFLSVEDGSEVKVLEGGVPRGDGDGASQEPFTMQDAKAVTCSPDGSFIVLRTRNDRRGYCTKLFRYDTIGNSLPLWKEPEGTVGRGGFPAFLRRLFGKITSSRSIPRFSELGDVPEEIFESDVLLASGHDGSLFLLCDDELAAFDPCGRKMYQVEIPFRWLHGGPVPGTDGCVYLLAEEDDVYSVLRVTAAGDVTRLDTDPSEGLDDPSFDLLALTGKTELNVLGYGGAWVSLSADAPFSQTPDADSADGHP